MCYALPTTTYSYNFYLFFQIALTDAQNECIYDKNGQVKRYDLPEEIPVFVPEEVRNSGLRPSRKDIVEFLLGLLEETDIPRY